MSAVLGRCRPSVGSRRCVPIHRRWMNHRIHLMGCQHLRHCRKSRVHRELRGGVVGSPRRWRSSRVVCWAPSAGLRSGTGQVRWFPTTRLYRRSGRSYRWRTVGWRRVWSSTGSRGSTERVCSSSLKNKIKPNGREYTIIAYCCVCERWQWSGSGR